MLQSKRIGIWGLGVVGTSLVRYFAKRGYQLGLMDKRELSTDQNCFLREHNVKFWPEIDKDNFFNSHDIIIPSAGIDVRSYGSISNKFVSELDLYHMFNTVRTIAITGTLGKTSITHLLSIILKEMGKTVITGGNIGSGLLDLVNQQADISVIELSSFQLDMAKKFAPDLAIITNLYSNHLDRHGTLEEYFFAKSRIVAYQTNNQKALVHADLYTRIKDMFPDRADNTTAFFADRRPEIMNNHDIYYYFNSDGDMVKEYNCQISLVAPSLSIPTVSYPINCLIIYAALDMLELQIPMIASDMLLLPDHRLAYVSTIMGADYYNDSKSTVPEATLAAVKQSALKGPVIALIGGTSKGIDRKPFIFELKRFTNKLICFGAEADMLCAWAHEVGIEAYAYKTLEEACLCAFGLAKSGDQVVFSPAGASFDLFSNYQERGKAFCALIKKYADSNRR